MPKSALAARLASLIAVAGALLVAFAATQSSALAATAHAVKHVSKPKIASSLPTQGIFGGCDIAGDFTTCQQDLAEMAAAGLKVDVMDFGSASQAQISAYAAAAQADGISVMWEIDDAGFWGGVWNGSSAAADYPEFATTSTTTTGVLDAMISFLASVPGTYGYYAADDSEITSGQTAALAGYVSEIKSIDPAHMVMIGASPSQGSDNAASGAVMGNEIYPETGTNIANQGDNLAAWDTIHSQITEAQDTADRDGQASAFILQAFTFGDNLSDGEAVGACTPSMTLAQCASQLRYPSELVQQELRNEVLTHAHAKLVLWYDFAETFGTSHQAGFTRAINAPAPSLEATAARAQAHAKADRARKHAKGHKRTVKKHAAKKHAAKKHAAKKHAAKKHAAKKSTAKKRIVKR